MPPNNYWKDAISQVSGAAILYILAKLFTKVVGLAFTLVVTHQVGAAGYGIYSYAISLIAVIMLIAPAGSNESLLRFLPEFREMPRKINSIVTLSFTTALGGGCIFGIALFFATPLISQLTLGQPKFIVFLQLTAILVPIRSLIGAVSNTFRALKLIRPQIAVGQLSEPILKLLMTLLAFRLGYSLYGVVIGIIMAGFLTLLIAIATLWYYTDVSLSIDVKAGELKSFYNFSLPISFRNIGSILYSKTDIIMLGWFVSSANIGIYNISVLLATLIALPLTGFNQLFPSFASELYHADQQEELAEINSTLIRWTLIISLFGISFLGVYRTNLLGIFGEDFISAEISLLLLLSGQLSNALTYGSGYFLTVSDHQYTLLINQWAFGLLNVGLNFIGIMAFGIHGAALATASVMALQNITRVAESWYLEGYFPYELAIFRPVVPAISGTLVMLAVQTLLDGYLSVAVGGLLGIVSYGILVYAFGLEQEDIELLEELFMYLKSSSR